MTMHRKRPASMVCLPLWSSNSVDDKFLNGKLFWCMMMKVTDVNVMYILPSNSLATCDQHPWTKVPHITHRFAKLYFGKPWNKTKKPPNGMYTSNFWTVLSALSFFRDWMWQSWELRKSMIPPCGNHSVIDLLIGSDRNQPKPDKGFGRVVSDNCDMCDVGLRMVVSSSFNELGSTRFSILLIQSPYFLCLLFSFQISYTTKTKLIRFATLMSLIIICMCFNKRFSVPRRDFILSISDIHAYWHTSRLQLPSNK